MIIGTGIDIVEIQRIKDTYRRKPAFAKRILTNHEFETFASLSEKRKIEFLAGRFAVKEAYSKALGCGIGKDLSFQDIEIRSEERGKPCIYAREKAKEQEVHVSITHTREYAAAQVIIESIH
ncbi:holo-ACP synthase [Salipaludibacillus neizhouensis]|uniref:Holo-[acyl-carrier-protein] synthase n=1 Tax=Salipaludibacillus neizhouensis TaxID=885475 RepID=A0A3A9KCJ5_9BACI|nr:holo-ACP synthase [Salipaludibacillus neizhouensis]RKL65105.1 holo-ACP synthase [Salipaludibacillus neizhouensis]